MRTYRILDVTDHRGDMGPWFLGRLGAQVVRIDAQMLPAVGYEYDSKVYNTGKHHVEIDLADVQTARRIVLKWMGWCDILFFSAPQGLLHQLDIDQTDITKAKPDIVSVAISPFGLDGPRVNQPCSELTIAALGGPVSLQGGTDRAPVKMSVNQVWRHAGMEAACASLIALRRALQCGEPQFVDVSAQAAMTWTMLNAMEAAAVQGADFERTGSLGQNGTDFHHQTRDGYTVNNVSGRGMLALAPWLVEEGIVSRDWLNIDYKTLDRRLATDVPTEISYADIERAMDELCARYDKEALLHEGLKRGITFAPVNTLADLLNLDHLEARDFWEDASEGHKRPGWPLMVDGKRQSLPGLVQVKTLEQPTLGELAQAFKDKVPDRSAALPLAGVKVADFSWIGVGPISTKVLADHGATVVRIESAIRPDGLRLQGPFKDREIGKNRSHFFGTFNTSKYSMTLDLSSASGLEIAKAMTDWADIVIDSFRPGTMEKLGLSPDVVHSTNPSAIVLSTSLMGGSGPLSDMAGYGFHAAGIAGFTELVGWPDRSPDGPWVAYTDVIAPRFLSTILLAALHSRDETGEGMTIDASQFEIGLQFLAPELESFQSTGCECTRMGNRDVYIAPQGVYPCKGDDNWCAISVTDDQTWRQLVAAMGNPAWASEGLETAAERLAAHDDIDGHLAAWTQVFDAVDLEQRLSRVGVPAGVVQRSSDLLNDPQYLHRSFYRYLDHVETGILPYAGHQYRIAGYEHGPRFAPPALGQHTKTVLSEFLGFSDAQIAGFEGAGVLK